jgi:hypothetical protein
MKTIIDLVTGLHFVYHQIMSVELADAAIARVAGAIAEPARAPMLCNLMDGRARTSTELAVIGPSTASVHLARPQVRYLLGASETARLRIRPVLLDQRHY